MGRNFNGIYDIYGESKTSYSVNGWSDIQWEFENTFAQSV